MQHKLHGGSRGHAVHPSASSNLSTPQHIGCPHGSCCSSLLPLPLLLGCWGCCSRQTPETDKHSPSTEAPARPSLQTRPPLAAPPPPHCALGPHAQVQQAFRALPTAPQQPTALTTPQVRSHSQLMWSNPGNSHSTIRNTRHSKPPCHAAPTIPLCHVASIMLLC